jgi:hypothetical protein
VGRTAPGRGLDREAVALAVAASVRHRDVLRPTADVGHEPS